jgi:hypothetical protein
MTRLHIIYSRCRSCSVRLGSARSSSCVFARQCRADYLWFYWASILPSDVNLLVSVPVFIVALLWELVRRVTR